MEIKNKISVYLLVQYIEFVLLYWGKKAFLCLGKITLKKIIENSTLCVWGGGGSFFHMPAQILEHTEDEEARDIHRLKCKQHIRNNLLLWLETVLKWRKMIEGPWSQLLSGIIHEHIHTSPFFLYITKIKKIYIFI